MKLWSYDKKGKSASDVGGLDRARLDFFANIVRELRTPLTVILGQIDAALVEQDDESRSHQLRVAGRNARRLERLTNQAAELTQLDASSLERRLREVEMVPFVESLVMSFEDLADRNGLVLEFFSRRASIRGRVDPDMLTTILSNLLSNAVKSTPAGGRIGVALDFHAPDLMHISVVDTGVGIATDQQAQIFEPFVRIRNDDTPGDGAGIGLALSRELARLHGGDISVQSKSGKGCRFDVSIPIGVEIADAGGELLTSAAERPQVTAEILFRSTVQSAAPSADAERARIMLIDSSDEFRLWAAEVLGDVASIDMQADNRTALRIAKESLPDLIIAEDKAPASDGIDLTRGLRADDRTSHIPVVLISALANSDRRAVAFNAGANDFFNKPIDARELRAKAASILERYATLRRQFREQVVFHPSDVCERSVDQEFLARVTSTIEASFESPGFTVQDLGYAVAMSTSQLSRKLRALIDQSPAQLIRRMRLQRAADLVAGNAGQISDICFRVGFSDQSHFSRSFKRHFGLSPVEYRRQHARKADD